MIKLLQMAYFFVASLRRFLQKLYTLWPEYELTRSCEAVHCSLLTRASNCIHPGKFCVFLETVWLSLMFVALPIQVFAATNLTTLVKDVVNPLLQALVVAGIAWALVVFVYEVTEYVKGENHKKAVQGMMWSVVAMFVIVSVWGLVHILQATLQIQGDHTITVPTFPSSN